MGVCSLGVHQEMRTCNFNFDFLRVFAEKEWR